MDDFGGLKEVELVSVVRSVWDETIPLLLAFCHGWEDSISSALRYLRSDRSYDCC